MSHEYDARRRECEMTGPTPEECAEGFHALVGSFVPPDEAGWLWVRQGRTQSSGIGTFTLPGFNRGGLEDPAGFDRPGRWRGAATDAPFGILGSGGVGQEGAFRDGAAIPVGEVHAGMLGNTRMAVGGMLDGIGTYRGDIYHRKPLFVGRNVMVDTGLDIDPITGLPADAMAVPVGGIGDFDDPGYNTPDLLFDPEPQFVGSRRDAPFGILGAGGIGTYDKPGFNTDRFLGFGAPGSYKGSRDDAPFGILGSGNIPQFRPRYRGIGSYTNPGFRGGYDAFTGYDKPSHYGSFEDAPFGARIGVGEITGDEFGEDDQQTALAAFELAQALEEAGFSLGDAWQSRDHTAHGWEFGAEDEAEEQLVANLAKEIAAERNIFYTIVQADEEHEFVAIFCSDPAACAIVDMTPAEAAAAGIEFGVQPVVGAFDWVASDGFFQNLGQGLKKFGQNVGKGFKSWREKMKARKAARKAAQEQQASAKPGTTSAEAAPDAVVSDDDEYVEVADESSVGAVQRRKKHLKITSKYILDNPRFLLTKRGRKWAETHSRQVDWFLRNKQSWLRRHPQQAAVLRRYDVWDPEEAEPQRWGGRASRRAARREQRVERQSSGRRTILPKRGSKVIIEEAEFEPEESFAQQYGAAYGDGDDYGYSAGFDDDEPPGAEGVRWAVSGYNSGYAGADGIGMPGGAPTSAAVGYLDDLGFYGKARTYGRGSNFQYPGG